MAAVETVDIAPNIITDAAFRAWGANISSHLADGGLVNVSNNIDWATVTTPGVINTKAGYEVWRFADALQATAPVFFKLEYGAGATVNQPRLHFQLGSGSHAGNTSLMTGPLSPANTYRVALTANSTNVEHCYFSSNTSYFNTWMFMNKDAAVLATATRTMGLSLERTKDATGADTGEGVLITCYDNTNLSTGIWDCKLGMLLSGANVLENPTPIFVPGLGTGATGANVAVYPIFHAIGNAFHNPCLALLGYFNADITVNTTATVSVYGTNHTYMAAGNNAVIQSAFRNTGVGFLIRYE